MSNPNTERFRIRRKPGFYDAQIKRQLVQLMATFAGYTVRTGTQRDGKERYLDVPIIYGDMSRTAGYIMAGGSENTTSYIPVMSLYMTGLRQKAEWRLNPQHYEEHPFWERAREPGSGELLVNVRGRERTIERYMPVPYDIRFNVSLWASNNDQGFQIIEQICSTYNPEMDVQLSNSPTDWTLLTTITFDGEVQMEKAIPSGSDIDPLYVFTFPFTSVIWIGVPVKVYDANQIHEIHVPILKLDDTDFDSMVKLDEIVIKADEKQLAIIDPN